MKIRIDTDEAYPTYVLYPEGDKYMSEIDLPYDLLCRWWAVQKAYALMQHEIAAVLSARKECDGNVSACFALSDETGF